MPDWLQPQFDKYRHWIDTERQRDRLWSDILLGKAGKELDDWLCGLVEYGDYPPLGDTPSARQTAWEGIVAGKKRWEEEAARNGWVPVVVGPDAADRDIRVPTDPKSSWQLYRRYLLDGSFRRESVDSIEASTIRILRRLRWETSQPDEAVKGMVVGHVQSGKTASMAGLISMSMDWSWNLVIVLTGTIENLRLQTNERLMTDLNRGGNLGIRAVLRPSLQSGIGDRSQDLNFRQGSNQRHLIVSLKNTTRLSDLKKWLERDPGMLAKMHILLIDDEADQASVDASPRDREARTTINQLIVDLTRVKAKCVNYVAYTATPYANFLNEAWPESLYPRNFIVALPQSTEHFGPKQVFGIAETESEGGLSIVCEIPPDDLRESSRIVPPPACMENLHASCEAGLPQSLKESVCWFLCATAAIRHYGDFRKPVSMLVHTSSRQMHHENVATAIKTWLCDKEVDHVSICRQVWADRTADLSLEQFRAKMPDYVPKCDLTDYPGFDSLEPLIRTLLRQITHINMEDTSGGPEPQYHDGIHICIDNCANNGVNDEGEHVRLLYPRNQVLLGLGDAPAFLVVGGSTLSRGLTIENLVSTYFLRSGSQMDTLMQMGRWFGYRGGYELLPRIWMPMETKHKFVFMAGVEQELREELALFQDGGRDPAEYGPRVRVHPSASWLRPTAVNKMKETQGAKFDFSGTNKQLTIFYTNESDRKLLRQNLERTDDFLKDLGSREPVASKSAYVWSGVDFAKVRHFLATHDFHGRARFFEEIRPFLEWFDENKDSFDRWNVVVAGRAPADRPDKNWTLPSGQTIGKITRTRLKLASDSNSVSIGVLRDPKDLLADAASPPELARGPSNSEIVRARKAAGLGNTPQLLLYRIDKDSAPDPQTEERLKLGTPEDLIGISIWIPGGKPASNQSFSTHVSVRIPEELKSDIDDLEPPTAA
jgi:Z1 domain